MKNTFILSRLARQSGRMAMFHSKRDWAVDAFSRLLHNYPRLPLPGRTKLARVGLAALPEPIYIRLGSSDHSVISEIFGSDEYGWILPHLDGPVKTIIDLGGNIGLSVRFWYDRLPDLSAVIVVEPDADNLVALRKNAEQLEPKPVAIEACVAGWHRPVQLNRGRSATSFTMAETEGAGEMATVTIPDLLAQLPPGSSIDLLKCDIEGAEQEVFERAGPWMRSARNMVVEVHGDYTAEHLKRDVLNAGGYFKSIVESPNRPGVVGFFGNTAGT